MGEAMKSVWAALKGLLGMKKTWALVATAIVWVVAKFGLKLPEQETLSAVAMLSSLFVGYVLQDIGKGDVQPKRIRDALFEMLSSKKAVAALVTLAVWVGTRVGLSVDPESISYVMNGATALILGIGFQDYGKAKEAQIAATTAASTVRKKK